MITVVIVATFLLVSVVLVYQIRAHRLGVCFMAEIDDLRTLLTDIKADTTATAATTVKIDADLTRVLEGIPPAGGLTAEQTAEVRASLEALKAETGALASAAAAVDARVPEPPA